MSVSARTRTGRWAGYASENLATLRRLALNLLKREQTKKRGIRGKQLNAGWDHAYLARLLGIQMRLPWRLGLGNLPFAGPWFKITAGSYVVAYTTFMAGSKLGFGTNTPLSGSPCPRRYDQCLPGWDAGL